MINIGWMDHVACRGEDPRLWDLDVTEDADWARAVCSFCPVRQTCLDRAKEERALGVIRGGKMFGTPKATKKKRVLTEKDKAKMRLNGAAYREKNREAERERARKFRATHRNEINAERAAIRAQRRAKEAASA